MYMPISQMEYMLVSRMLEGPELTSWMEVAVEEGYVWPIALGCDCTLMNKMKGEVGSNERNDSSNTPNR